MQPSYFGGGTWIFIFMTIFSPLPVETVKRTIYQLVRNLPCPACSRHTLEYLKEKSFLEMESKYDFLIVFLILRNRFYDHINTDCIKDEHDMWLYKDILLAAIIDRKGLTTLSSNKKEKKDASD